MSFSIFGGGKSQQGKPQQKEPGAAQLIKETTTQDFVRDVLEASKEVPVLVDFWAPWCGPCRQLTPILEKTVKAAKGSVRLVKMNIDNHPEVAGQLGVQSIPAVFAFKNGRPVDGFMGALPESQVKTFIERIAGKEAFAGSLMEQAAEALQAGDVNSAAECYAAALEDDSENVEAIAGLAQCYIRAGDLDRAEKTLAMAPASKKNAAAVVGAQAALELARKSASAGDARSLENEVERNPGNFQARFDLALALNARGDKEGALEQLLTIIRRDREWSEGAARKQLIEFFDAWGGADPLTVSGRQRLSTILFS
jgi:putative thioredoxin